MKKNYYFKKTVLAFVLAFGFAFVNAQDSKTVLDFETMVSGDTIFIDQGNLPDSIQPLNWVYDAKSPDKNSKGYRVPETMAVPTLVDGIIGKAMQFDGKKEWVLLQHPYAYANHEERTHFAEEAENFTASIWFNNASTSVNPPKKPEQMIYNTLGMGLLIKSDTLWAGCYVKDRADAARYRGGALIGIPFTSTDAWTNVVSVFEGKAVNDSTSLFKVYVNGVEVASKTIPAATLYVDEYDAAYVGAHYKWGVMDNLGAVGYVAEGDVNSYYKGLLDDFTTSHEAMSAVEVRSAYYAVVDPGMDVTATHLDFETLMAGDTAFQDQGNMLPGDQPLNWVFDSRNPNPAWGAYHPLHGATPVLVDGIVGKAMQFDGKKYWVYLQQVEFTGYPFKTDKENFTASVWFNIKATHTNPPKNPDQFIYDIGGQGGLALQVRQDTLWATCFTRRNGPEAGALIKVPFTKAGEWVNVVSVFDGMAVDDSTSTFSLYVNGELVGVENVAAPVLKADAVSSGSVGAHFQYNSMDRIGKASYVAYGEVDGYMKGMIDELTTTQNAKSAAEIREAYYAIADPDMDLTATHLDFETLLAGDTVFQEMGNMMAGDQPLNQVYDSKHPDKEPDGNNTRYPDHGAVPNLVDGIVGKAMLFDGKKEWILLQKAYDKGMPFNYETEDFSASVWFNNATTHTNPPKNPDQFIYDLGGNGGFALQIRQDTLWATCYSRDRDDKTKPRDGGIVKVPFTSTDKWTNVVSVFDGMAVGDSASIFKVYVNGELVGQDTVNTPKLYAEWYSASSVGAKYKYCSMDVMGKSHYIAEGDVTAYFKGMIDELTTTQTALSDQDVKDIVYAAKGDATTYLDFETLMAGDTVFQEMGNMLPGDQPLNQVFDSKHPDKEPDGNNTRYPDHGAVPNLVDGIVGKAMLFDGKKEWILLQKAYDKGMPFNSETEDFSASVWFNNETTHTNPPKNPDQFIYDLGGNGGFALQVRQDTLWATCYSRDRDDKTKNRDGALVKVPFTSTNEWTNVVSVFDGMAVGDSASVFKVYVNGELVGQDTVNTPVLYSEWYSASSVGAKYKYCSMDVMGKSHYIAEGDVTAYFKGMIDELKTQQSVMSSNDIRKQYLAKLDIQKVVYDFENQTDGDGVIYDAEGKWDATFHSSFLTNDEQSGHNPHLLPELGQATFDAGIKDEGKALVFDGKKDWVNVQIKYDGYYPEGVPPFGDSYDNLTARVWINPVATSVNPPKNPEQMIIMVGHGNGVAMMIEKDTLFAGVSVRERGGDKKYNSNVILKAPFTRAGMWSQVAIVFEGQAVNDTVSKAILYINGNAVDSSEIAGDKIYSSYFNSTTIGGQYSWNPLGSMTTYAFDSEVNCYFKGKMDNILITKEAVSAQDMADDYNAHRPTGIESFNSEHINVYPNPTTGTIYLNLSDLKESANVKVLNMVGVVVKDETIEMPGSRESINLKGLNTGLYFIRVQSGNNVYTSKVQLIK